MANIVVINESTVVSDEQVDKALEPLRKQVMSFCGHWDIRMPVLRAVSKGATLDASAWKLGIYDDTDQADALGDHDETSGGMPLGKVFAKTALTDLVTWTSVLSHEMLEMLADPWINFSAEGADGKLRALEVCDAVEEVGYEVDGVEMSNYVLPAWFSLQPKISGPFDRLGKCTAPFELLSGGYISILEGSEWAQVFADHKAMSKRPAQVGSRRERRRRLHRIRMLTHGHADRS